jgi:Uma2 family endonuclease
MTETDIHRKNVRDLLEILGDRFADDPMVYVSADLLIYYQEGDMSKRLAPDVFVVRGVPKHHRDSYLIWGEGKAPDLVIELTSKRRRREDQKKIELYRDVLKVPELFTIDPGGGYFDSPLRGFRWSESGYIAIEPGQGPGLHSELLGLNLAREGYALCLFDPTTGRKLPTVAEDLDGAETMRVQIEKARRLIAAELDLAEMRRQVAESNVALTEAQLELAETQIEQLKSENDRFREILVQASLIVP